MYRFRFDVLVSAGELSKATVQIKLKRRNKWNLNYVFNQICRICSWSLVYKLSLRTSFKINQMLFSLTALWKRKTNSSDRKPPRQKKRKEESQRKKHSSNLDKDRKGQSTPTQQRLEGEKIKREGWKVLADRTGHCSQPQLSFPTG